jgi:hypothetical protein
MEYIISGDHEYYCKKLRLFAAGLTDSRTLHNTSLSLSQIHLYCKPRHAL